VRRELASGARAIDVELGDATAFDSFGVGALLRAIVLAERQGAEVRLHAADERLREYLSMLDLDAFKDDGGPKEREPFLARMGGYVLPAWRALKAQFAFSNRVVYYVFIGPFRNQIVHWDRVARELVLVGLNALPIIVLILSLVGMILAIQAAAQLRQFGALIYIADLVGVSLTREIGPLLTGLIVAGRSGSANTAEIGSMVVSEELDAIRQMGIDPARYLLVPKVIALTIALPCLAVIGDVVGILSAAFISSAQFGLNVRIYFDQTQKALLLSDFTTGLFKCLFFGLLIGVVSCSQGLAVKSGADEVGRRTTTAVVLSTFYIICADTFFTWIFHGL
jgi:phospholipid/cholesterol/gamma-HCH transport system permease protein